MRVKSDTDFFVDVPQIGRFSFARRAPRDVFRIRAEYNRFTDGYSDSNGDMEFGAFMFATLKVLMVSAPDGFDLEKLDPVMDDNWEDGVVKIFKSFRDTELLFRPKPVEAVQGKSPTDGHDISVEVPQEIQPTSN